MGDPVNILTPVGRLVGGDCFKPQTTDAEGRPLVIKKGPNAGQPRVNYYLGLAIPKTDPNWSEIYGKIYNVARAEFPNLFDAQGNCINPAFAFKVTDGDSQVPNANGNKPCDFEGYPGHWILNFSNGFYSKCYHNGLEVTDPNAIKKGYYIRIYGSVKGNESVQQPGVYLNHSLVELVGYGEELITGPSAGVVFGTAAALPAGASATPVAPTMALVPPVQAGAPPVIPVTQAGVVGAITQAGAVGAITPAPDFLNLPPAPPQMERKYNVQGTEYTTAQLKAAKWTDEQIAALG